MTDNPSENKEKLKADAHTSIESKHIKENCTKKENYTENKGNRDSGPSSRHEISSDVVIVRYGELALKSTGVRNWYEKILIKNIAAMLDSRSIPYSQIRREWGRIFIETADARAAKLLLMFLGLFQPPRH